jgi:hypothetical protein
MFRRLFLTAMLGIGTLTSLALTPSTAEARSMIEYRYDGHKRVEVHYGRAGGRHKHGVYQIDTHRTVHHLRHRR